MASSIGVKIKTNDSMFIAKIDKIKVTSMEAARKFVTDGGLMLEANVKSEGFIPRPANSQKRSASGRIYYTGPATPPKPTQRTGNLRNHFQYRSTTQTAFGYKSITGTYVRYAAYVDFGTSRSRKFPFAEDGVSRILPRLKALAADLFREAQND